MEMTDAARAEYWQGVAERALSAQLEMQLEINNLTAELARQSTTIRHWRDEVGKKQSQIDRLTYRAEAAECLVQRQAAALDRLPAEAAEL